MNFGGQTPTIVVLKEGTDTSQGKGQTISNINACIAVSDTLRPTLGPMGSDVMLVDAQGKTTISNDGATILSLLEIVHPAARLLVDISRSQDAEVGDGTSSVTILAGELLKEARAFVEDNVPVQAIIKGYRRALTSSLQYINTLKKEIDVKSDEDLRKVAATAMSSKIIHQNAEFFTKMVVDAIRSLDVEDLNEKMIGIKTVTGGAIQDSLFVGGTAFKKTFSYAGFEQQPKRFVNPKICCLDVELELKAEKDNAEVRVKEVSEYQNIVDAEWKIIIDKLQAIYDTGAQVVLSSLPIGDLATQFFADRDIFCAGRVAAEDMDRVLCSTGAVQQSTCSSIKDEYLGRCELFEERQIGNERFNFFTGGASARSCTLILRGGSEQFISEVERSLHDALMVVKRTVRNSVIVAGGGACEMAVSKHLREMSRKISSKEQLVVGAYARALEVIPRQLSENAGFDSTDLMNLLRMRHARDETNVGIDFATGSVADNLKKFVWEPALVKINALSSATEAACVVLSVDETVQNKESASQAQMPIPR